MAAIILAGLVMGCGENPEPDPSATVNTTKVIPGVNAPLTGTAKPRPKREKPKPSLNLEIEPPTQQTDRRTTAINTEVNRLLEMF